MKREIYAAKLATGSFVGLMMGFSPNKIEASLIKENPECDPKLIKAMLAIAIDDFRNESTEAHI